MPDVINRGQSPTPADPLQISGGRGAAPAGRVEPSGGPVPLGGAPWPGRRAGGSATAATSRPCRPDPVSGGHRPARCGRGGWSTPGTRARPRRRTRYGSSAPGSGACLLYTSDAADEEDSVDLGGRRIIKKKKK